MSNIDMEEKKYLDRTAALQRLVNRYNKENGKGGIAHISKETEIDRSSIQRMLYPPGKTGRKRIGEQTADALEAKFPGWQRPESTEDHKFDLVVKEGETSRYYEIKPDPIEARRHQLSSAAVTLAWMIDQLSDREKILFSGQISSLFLSDKIKNGEKIHEIEEIMGNLSRW